MQRDIAHHTENLGKEALNDKLTNDKLPTSTSPGTTAAKPQLSQPGGLGSLNQDADKDAKSASTPTDRTAPKGYTAAPGSAAANPDPRGASAPSSPGSISIYRNLMQRGRSLSQPGVAQPAAVAGDNPDVDARLKKDPVGSYSYGSSPVRFPMGGAPNAAAASQGPSAQGFTNPNSGTLGGNLGSIQRYTPGDLPRFQRGLNNTSVAPPPSTDPAARTYDPSQASPSR